RQCALAFVEAQAFGWQLARIANEPLLAQDASPRQSHAAVRSSSRLTWPLALAASGLGAFLAGRQLADPTARSPEIAGGAVKDGAAKSAVSSSAANDPDVKAEVEGTNRADAAKTLTSLTLRPYGGEDSIELPLVDSDDAAMNAAGRSLAVS